MQIPCKDQMSITVSDCATSCLYLNGCTQMTFGQGANGPECWIQSECVASTDNCENWDTYVQTGTRFETKI